MIELYVGLVIRGKRTCDTSNEEVKLVPANLRKEVIGELKRQGYDKNGKKIK